MNADGTSPTRLFSREDSWSPKFSPDGKKITFYSDATDEFEIYIMNADGTDAKKLTSVEGATYPCFSPDGRYIVYSGYVDDIPQLYTYRLKDGKQGRLLKSKSHDMTPRWSKVIKP